MCPGRVGVGALSGVAWKRDLAADFRVLDREGVDLVVCLLEDHELPPGYLAATWGRAVVRVPVPDAGVPPVYGAFAVLVRRVAEMLRRGKRVVVHCAAGLGRSGTFAGCVLRTLGLSTGDALRFLREARGPTCPETQAQVDFVLDWTP